MRRKSLVRGAVVAAHSDHLGTRRGEIVIGVAEGTGLRGAAGGLVLGIEVEHHRLSRQELAQTDGCAIGVRQGEVRGAIADVGSWHEGLLR